MKFKSTFMLAWLGLGLCTSCTPETPTAPQDYTQYVNTFIGAADNGHTFPGACLPFGLIPVSYTHLTLPTIRLV